MTLLFAVKDTNALKTSVGSRFAHLLELEAREGFPEQVVVRILGELYAGVGEILHELRT